MPLVSLLLSAGLLHFRELCCQKGATAPLDPAAFYYLLFNIYRQTINLCEYKRVWIVYLLAGTTADSQNSCDSPGPLCRCLGVV